MYLEKKSLVIDEALDDGRVGELHKLFENKKIKKIVIKNPDLGPAIVQYLLFKSKETAYKCEDPLLDRFFKSVASDENHPCYQ